MGNRAGMYGSEAGLVRMGSRGPKTILTTTAAAADSSTGAGSTLGIVTCQEAKFWKNWTMTLSGTFSGYTVTWYGSLDGVNWFPLPGTSTESGTPVENNPMTAVGQMLEVRTPLYDVKAVAAGIGQTGTLNAQVSATP